jgi:hypothetical protein
VGKYVSIFGIAAKTGHQVRNFQGLLIRAPIRYTTISSPRTETSAVKRPRWMSAMGGTSCGCERHGRSRVRCRFGIVSARVVSRSDRVFPAIPRSRRRKGGSHGSGRGGACALR